MSAETHSHRPPLRVFAKAEYAVGGSLTHPSAKDVTMSCLAVTATPIVEDLYAARLKSCGCDRRAFDKFRIAHLEQGRSIF